jgi:cyclophilin family peptidyl-prolyl cis-trans isomerase/HEAT repeat protein
MEAAVGTGRWSPDAPGAREVDRALLDALHPYRITPDSTPKSAVEAELLWRILWALGRRKAELGRGPFLEYASSSVALERLFALRGLGELVPDAASWRAATAALVGPESATDWRVAYEAAVALGRFAARQRQALAKEEQREPMIEALRAGSEHKSAHVRAGTMDALGSFPDGEDVRAILQRGRLDLSPSVRASALKARVRISELEDALDIVGRDARDDDPVVRAAVAEAAAGLADGKAAAILERLTRDPSVFVATRAIEQLGKQLAGQPGVRAELHAALAHADNGMRLGAVLGLRELPDASDVEPLAQAYATSTGDVAAEVAYCALQNLGRIGGDAAKSVVDAARDDARPYVRAIARRVLRESFGMDVPLSEEESELPSQAPPLPVPGKDGPLWRFNPMVEMVTSRGALVFELVPAEAPLHVHSFLALVEGGAYRGLTFHRVVPDFVVQGGDYRGDGNGALPWKGEALRAEFTPRKYTRGSLGMPRNDDSDSGGSQFFITHVPTPHLDGRYTVFGELRRGGEVLDQLEVGDRILSISVVR